MRTFSYSKSSKRPDVLEGSINVYNEHNNLLDFSSWAGQQKDTKFLIFDSFFLYKTESNYRKVLLNFLLGESNGSLLIIEERNNVNITMLLRVLRCLGIYSFCRIYDQNEYKCINIPLSLTEEQNEYWKQPNLLEAINSEYGINLACDAIIHKKPFSLVRVGHCEIKFICFGYFFGQSDLSQSCQIQWGVDSIDDERFNKVRSGIEKAISSATILGFYERSMFSADTLKILENSISRGLIDRSLIKPSQYRVKPNIHWDFGVSTSFFEAMACSDRIVLVTPRLHLAEKFKSIYQKDVSIEILPIPGEHKMGGEFDICDRFRKFDETNVAISKLAKPGVTFLVGGGVAGKLFCHTAVSNGAVAIDLGSTLDGWADVDSRGGGFNGKFSIFLHNFSLI